MKKLLFSTFLLTGIFTTKAQTIYFSEDFSASNSLTNWQLIDADGDGFNWGHYGEAFFESLEITSSVVGSFSYNRPTNTPLNPDNWLISPAIDLTQVTGGNLSLNWEVRSTDPDYDDENYSIYVATMPTTVEFENSNVSFSSNTQGINEFTPQTLDISSMAGQTIYVAFRHHNSNNQFNVLLDNITVTGPDDLSTNNHLADYFSIYPNPTTDVININNHLQTEVQTISVVDVNGRVIAEFADTQQINITALNAGIYFVNINTAEGILTAKIIKQ